MKHFDHVAVKKTSRWLLAIMVGSLAFISFEQRVKAQITPDATLGTEHSTVTPNARVRGQQATLIEGGALRDSNLFHSFSDFNVGNSQTVYFDNPATVENIFGRVTGNEISTILGTLGINGPANLYFLNPNGVAFGSNARLDIQGSLTVSTAEHFRFEDGSQFGVASAEPLPLLTVTTPLGLQPDLAPNMESAITSQGTLSVGRNLSLHSDTLKLQGQIAAGENITLLGTDTVEIRDSLSRPFLAVAAGNLSVQGDELVDIFALSHADSGLQTGGDIVLRSANSVVGDAHYFSGGNYRIEQLDGQLGQLYSPFDPVIRASGDVSFASYTGASLHILAGGSVTIPGDIVITGTESEANSLQSQVTLSNGTTVVNIDGSTEPTLDIRAGTRDFGTPGITGPLATIPTLPETQGATTNADINIGGQITVGNGTDGGTVLLTNRFQPNDLDSPNGITVSGIDVRDSTGGGSVFLDSRSDVTIDGLVDASASDIFSAAGGDVTMLAAEAVAFSPRGAIFSYGLTGGNIALESDREILTSSVSLVWSVSVSDVVGAQGGNLTVKTPELDIGNASVFGVYTAGRADAGNIDLQVDRLNVDTSGRVEAVTFGQGDAGNLSVRGLTDERAQSVRIRGDLAPSIPSPSGLFNSVGLFDNTLSRVVFGLSRGFGDAGELTIKTDVLDVLDGGRISTDITGQGNAGFIDIEAGAINVVGFNPENSFISGIFSAVTPLGNGTGGDIEIQTEQLRLADGGFVSASTFNQGDAGSLTIDASEIEVIGLGSNDTPSRIRVNVASGAAGQGGAIALTVDDLQVRDGAEILANTEGNGNGGSVNITAREQIVVTNGGRVVTSAAATSMGESGNIRLAAPDILISDRSEVSATTAGNGRAGTILIEPLNPSARLNLDLQASEISASTSGSGAGGDIIVNASTVQVDESGRILTTTSGSADAGRVTLQAQDRLHLSGEGTGIFANASANAVGNSGNVEINNRGVGSRAAGLIDIRNGAGIAVNNEGTGLGGDIQLQASRLNLDNRAFISAETASNQGGDIEIETQDLLLLRNNSQISTTAGTAQSGGDGGNLTIRTPFLIAIPTENSDITANAFEGEGGSINITSQGIFGLTFRTEPTVLSDITASSTLGVDGEVILNSPDTAFLENSLSELPDAPIDTDTLVASSCIAPTEQDSNRLVLTGADGIPEQSGGTGIATVPTGTVRTFAEAAVTVTPEEHSNWQIGDPIVEPQSLYQVESDRLVLSRNC